MRVQIPHWALAVKDEPLLLLIAFAHRVTMKYGHDTWYSLHKEDAAIICNKRASGLVNWLQEQETGLMEFGEPYDHTLIFKMPYIPHRGGNQKLVEYIEFSKERERLIWMYILGCVNHNIIQDNIAETHGRYRKNTYQVTEFSISRVAEGYIKKKDRDLK